MAITTEITEQDRAAFREQGFVVIPGVLDDTRLAAAREQVARRRTRRARGGRPAADGLLPARGTRPP